MKHKHHIIPRHAGGTDDPDNIVVLSIEEHAEAHLKLFEEHGNQFDWIAYECLSGMITKEEVMEYQLSEAGKRGGAANKGRVPWNKGKKASAESRQKMSESAQSRVITEETRERYREGGRKAGRQNKGNKRPDLAERNRGRRPLRDPTTGRFI